MYGQASPKGHHTYNSYHTIPTYNSYNSSVHCQASPKGQQLLPRVKRWVVLRRWRRALGFVTMGLALSWLLRRVRALRLWSVRAAKLLYLVVLVI